MRRVPLLALLATVLLAPAAEAGTSFTIGTGSVPAVLTDPLSGDAKIAWAETDYIIKFCTIPAGTQTCTQQTVWSQPASPANAVGQPNLLRDTDGTLYLVLHRYVGDSKWLFKSTDGGATWGAGSKIYDDGYGTNAEQVSSGRAPARSPRRSGTPGATSRR